MTILPQVLFVTNRDDFATDYLIYSFLNKNIPYLRLNSEDITEFKIMYNITKTTVKINCSVYDLSDVKSVYFRRAPTIFEDAINIEDTPFINRERRDFFEGLYLTLHAKWINPLYSTYKAERKLFQLQVAKDIGLQVPQTIVSNDPSEIIEFVENNINCIIKPISHGLQITSEGAFSIYTSEISNLEWLQTNSLFESPVLIQKKINNYRDIRATIIGNRIFAVEIEKQDNASIDWRQPNIVKKYKVHILPEKINSQLLLLHKRLNLIYSAVDFVLTPEGDYIFLETNPAGEWVWLEQELNLKISEAIIDELLS